MIPVNNLIPAKPKFNMLQIDISMAEKWVSSYMDSQMHMFLLLWYLPYVYLGGMPSTKSKT